MVYCLKRADLRSRLVGMYSTYRGTVPPQGLEFALRLGRGAALNARRAFIHHRTRSNPTSAERAKKAGHPFGCPVFLVAATDLIVHIREHLPILLGTRVTAFREPQNRKAAK